MKNNMKQKFYNIFRNLYIIVFLACFTNGYADGKYAGASMELGVGARPLALGGAAGAMTGGAELFHYNPSALAYVEKPVISLMYAPTFESFSDPLAHYNYAGIAYPLPGGGTIAFNWTRFSVDDIPIYPDPKGASFAERNSNPELQMDGEALGYFEDVEDVYYISFAKALKKNIPVGWMYDELPIEIPFGMNFKLVRQKLYQSKASGMGIDIGAMIKVNFGTLFDKKYLGDFAVGLSSSDITQTPIIWDTKTEDRIRRSVLLGLHYQQLLGFSNAQIKFYWSRYRKYDRNVFYGAEFLIKGLAVRVGKNAYGITSGAGLYFWKFVVDYAFVTNQLDDVHRISCSINLR